MTAVLSDAVGISIPTKDRWDDLELTLAELERAGLDALETIVTDDGSSRPAPAHLAARFPWVRFMRFETSANAFGRRNQIAKLLSKPFILGLDDDSFPLAGDLAAAADYLQAHPNVAALALQIIFRNQAPPPGFAARPHFPVRDYIGCGALIRRDVFIAVGGYEENFGFYLEEPEYCLRAMQQGHVIEAWPAVIIQHNLTPVARNQGGRARSLIHKETLMALWFYPHPQSWIRALSCFPAMLMKQGNMRPYWRALLAGWLEAFYNYFFRPHRKRRFSREQFRQWRSLPMAVEVVQGGIPVTGTPVA